VFKKITNRLRKWDQSYLCYDKVFVNSQYTADLALQLYGLKSDISYPKINPAFFEPSVEVVPHNYHLFVGRLTKLVRETDKIIRLFNEAKFPLLVMGSGPDELELQHLARETIIFLGWIVDTQERVNIIKNAK